ncbi:MAG: histidine phosphatase family protein [Geminicoccaceae bacterium]
MRLCMLRHATTDWNERGLIQGHTDRPLSPVGRAEAGAWHLPPGFARATCVTSPLRRTRETAALLGFVDPASDPRLAEMHWGAFEGRQLPELRAEQGDGLAAREALGLDFRPPGGESPREVVARLRGYLAELAGGAGPHVLVTHKGVLRAALVLAFAWDMLGKPPVRLETGLALLFELAPDGTLTFTAATSLGQTPA